MRVIVILYTFEMMSSHIVMVKKYLSMSLQKTTQDAKRVDVSFSIILTGGERMDWQKGMNEAMTYIESNLDAQIDYQKAASYMHCSEWEFRRIFSFLAQCPLSDYVRHRRLTVAAYDIQNGEKIIDIAHKYGYDSQAAFSRAFRKMHGLAPSLARDKETMLNPCPRLTFKLALLEGLSMDKGTNERNNVIGANDGYAVTISKDVKKIHTINDNFWSSHGNELLGATALPLYGAFVSEEKHQLLGDLSKKKVLEIACGSGHSLKYIGDQKASELWGVDISKEQIRKTEEYLQAHGYSSTLICSAMESKCGLPSDYFDLVYSVYGIGWATDLNQTFENIYSYLKVGGSFIFSWSHPIHKCVAFEGDSLLFKRNYYDESWYSVAYKGGLLSLTDRKMSTYINALAKAGFHIEEMIESSDDELIEKHKSKFAEKASILPVTFVIKATKR